MSPKQQQFVHEYMIDLNATEAAARAGYSDPNYGRQLLTIPDVQNAIQKKREKLQKRTDITAERVLNEEKTIAYIDPRGIIDETGALIPLQDLPEELARAIASVKVIERFDKDNNRTVTHEYKFWDKGRSLERVSRHLGLYNDSVIIKMDAGLKAIMAILPPDIQEQVMTKLSESKAKK